MDRELALSRNLFQDGKIEGRLPIVTAKSQMLVVVLYLCRHHVHSNSFLQPEPGG